MSDAKSTITVAQKLGVKHDDMNDNESRISALPGAFNSANLDEEPEVSDQQTPSSLATPPSNSATEVPQAETNTGGKSLKDKFKKTGKSATAVGREAINTGGGTPNVSTGQTMSTPSKVNSTTQSNRPHGVYRLTGLNIGSAANEPSRTPQQLKHIELLSTTILRTVSMSETRRSSPDAEHRYVDIDEEGRLITKPTAMLPRIGWNDFVLGLGKAKADEKTGKGRMYSDVVMYSDVAKKGPNWALNQWTSLDVVIEGVVDNVLEKPARLVKGKPERRSGHDFVRIVMPMTSLAPVFETRRSSIPTVLEWFTPTKGYYWTNAS